MTISRYPFSIVALLLLFVLPNAALGQQPLPAAGDESELLALLDSNAELFDKAKACQRLAVIGTAKSVPVVSKLLADPELSHYARTALESNPSTEVDQALRNALSELKGAQLVGVINSIAARNDTQTVGALIDLAAGDDQQVAAAAISALGLLVTPESISALQQVLTGDAALRVTAADACLAIADSLLADGRNADALGLLQALRSAELPQHINVAARFGEIRAGFPKCE